MTRCPTNPEEVLTSELRPDPSIAAPVTPVSSVHMRGCERASRFSAVVLIAFLVMGCLGILNHEMWRDELNPWLLARSSASIVDLHNVVRHEGHPILWYLCQFVLLKWTHDLFPVQALHLGIAAGSVYLFVRYSPFTRLQKVLFCFGYFPLFEYATISRCYALATLAVMAFCALLKSSGRNYLILFSALSLMANADVLGTIIALSFAIGLVLEYFIRRRPAGDRTSRTNLLAGLAIFGVAVAIAVAQMVPPSDGFKGNGELGHLDLPRLKMALNAIAIGYLPIPNLHLHFWSDSLFASQYPPRTLWVTCGAGLFLLFLAGFTRKPLVLAAYACGTAGMVALFYLVYSGAVRNYGMLFILLVACLWVSRSCYELEIKNAGMKRASGLIAQLGNRVLTLLLVVHVSVGFYAVRMDWLEPFSQCKSAANFIKQRALDHMPIAAYPDFIAGSLSAWLDRRVHRLDHKPTAARMERPDLSMDTLSQRLHTLLKPGGGQWILVTNVPMINKHPSLAISLLQSFDRSIVADEICYVYLVSLNRQ